MDTVIDLLERIAEALERIAEVAENAEQQPNEYPDYDDGYEHKADVPPTL